MEQAEDVASLAPVPVFVDDTGRRRRLTSRIGRVLLVGFSAYIGLVLMGFARDPRLGALHLPTVGLPDLGLMIPPAPLVLGEQTTRAASADEIEVSTAGPSDEGLAALAPTSGGPPVPSSSGASGPSTKPTGVAPVPGPTPGRPSAPGTSTTSTSTSTTTTTIARTNSPTTTPTTAPSTPPTTLPTTPGQGSVAAKGPDGSGPPGRTTEPPGQQRKTTTTTAG